MSPNLASIYATWHVPIRVAVILLITLAVSVAVHVVLRVRGRRLDPVRESAWLGAALDALNMPLQCMIWLIGLSAAVTRLTTGGGLPLLDKAFAPTRDVAVVVIVAWFLIRVVPRATRTLALRTTGAARDFDETAADAINKIVIASILIVALFIAVQALGFSVASLLTFGGVAGIAVGFAAQGLVANLLGGVTIYASKPFGVGDHIILPGTKLRGSVQEIGWRATRILGWDGKPFYVPNAKFNTETIVNHTRLAFRRISETILLRLEDIPKVPEIVTDVNAMLAGHPEMRHANEYFVFHMDGLNDHAAKLYLYAYTRSTTYAGYMAAKEDILLKIVDIIRVRGARLALPVNVLYAPQGAPWGEGPGAGPPQEPPA